MSEPAIFVFVRDKTCRFYLDRWAGVFLFRDLIWGPDQLENWAQTTCSGRLRRTQNDVVQRQRTT